MNAPMKIRGPCQGPYQNPSNFAIEPFIFVLRYYSNYYISFVESYAEFMKTNCTESCGFCEEESKDNIEHAANCPAWKNMGYCETG